ncbi:MAG: hypothetical protein R6V75_01730 [Bacteroidales bacterium]
MNRTLLLILLFTGILLCGCDREGVKIPPPEISGLVIEVENPTSDQPVSVGVTVFDLRGITSVRLFYQLGSEAFISVAMQPVGGTGRYAGEIPAQPSGTLVSYYVEAENVSGIKATLPAGAPTTILTYQVAIGRNIVPVTPLPLVRLPYDLYETSGITMTAEGKIWSHNDSGNENKLYCIDLAGNLLRTITITGAPNIDWEDIAVDKQKRIYIGDAGNNDNKRRDLAIYRIPDPETFSDNSVTPEKISFSFADQYEFPPPAAGRNFDVEGIFWHQDTIFLFTKDRSVPLTGFCRMYKLPAIPGTQTAVYAGQVFLGSTIPSARVTAADIHAGTGRVALLVQERLIVFSEYPGNRFFEGKMTEYGFTTLPGQAEAIHFATGSKLYMTEEGSNINYAGYLYEIRLPD